MTAALLLLVGVATGWIARSVVIAKQNARRTWCTGALGLRQQQVMSEIAAQRRRSEEQMRRIVYQKGGS